MDVDGLILVLALMLSVGSFVLIYLRAPRMRQRRELDQIATCVGSLEAKSKGKP